MKATIETEMNTETKINLIKIILENGVFVNLVITEEQKIILDAAIKINK